MANITLPQHMLDFLTDVLPRNRALFGDVRMEDDDDAKAAAEKAAAEAKAAADKAAADAAQNGDKGFPENTPVDDMTAAQQANYWKYQSRKHEQRVKDFGGFTPEQVKDFKAKADLQAQAEKDKQSETEKAVNEAKETAAREAQQALTPKLVRAEFKAALTGRVKPEELDDRLTAITDPLDLSKFLNDAGDVDTDKVTKFVENITPATGTSSRRGPTATGHGSGSGSQGSGLSGLSGSDLYDRLHPKKTA